MPFDYIRENARMAVEAGAFGTTDAVFLPPLAPRPVPFTPKHYALAVIAFWQDNIVAIFSAFQKQARNAAEESAVKQLVSIQQRSNPLMVAEWERVLSEPPLQKAMLADSDSFVGRLIRGAARGAREALEAYQRSIGAMVPDEDGFGENLPPQLAAEFWSGWAKLAVAASSAEAEVVELSITDELVSSAKARAAEAGEFIGEAAEATAELAADVIVKTAEIAGEGLGGFLRGVGVVPIAIGAAAVYVGVKVL